MKLFDRLFSQPDPTEEEPLIRFGRYTDSYKTSIQYDYWDKALEAFEREDYLTSYTSFFHYLRDEQEDNVHFQQDGSRIEFEIFQGSKRIIGYATIHKLKAEARVARAKAMDIGFMRRLIEHNYDLNYSRYALDDNDFITIVFDTYSLDGSPYKLYYALKEIATSADKQDDLLLDEFPMLELIEATHLKSLEEKEKEVKYQFIQDQIRTTFEEIDSGRLNAQQYPGGISYLLLHLCYKLDYLTKPEGYMMEAFERSNRLYFAKDDKSEAQKNQFLRKELQKLLDRPKDQYFKEMYQGKSTFGITSPVNHDKLVSFIDGEMQYMDWYREHQHDEVALAIPGYVVGFCLFNYAVPKPDRDLMHLYWRIVEAPYFQELGFQEQYYDPSTKKFDKKLIKRALRRVVENNAARYPNLNPSISRLNFDNLVDFAKSFLLMIRDLDMTRTE